MDEVEVRQQATPSHDEPAFPNRRPPDPPKAGAKDGQSSSCDVFGGETFHIPSLDPVDAAQWSALSLHEDGQNGALIGAMAESIFDGFDQIYDVLSALWSLLEREQGDELDQTDFVLAMHLLTCIKTGTMMSLPLGIPPELYRAAVEACQLSPSDHKATAILAQEPKHTATRAATEVRPLEANKPSESNSTHRIY